MQRFLSALCLASLMCLSAAAEWVWDGGSTNSAYWSDATNWSDDSSVPVSDPATVLVFGDGSWLEATNDLGFFQLGDLIFSGITFPALRGDGLEIFHAIVNTSLAACTIYNDVILGSDVTVRAWSGGVQMMGSNNIAGFAMRLEGSNNVYFSKLYGGGAINIYGPGGACFCDSNAFTGAIHVYGGGFSANATDSLRNVSVLTVEGASTAEVSDVTGLFAEDVYGRTARVSDVRARIDVEGTLFAGFSNRIVAASGGRVEGPLLKFGTGRGNTLTVEGGGSLLHVADLIFERASDGGCLLVTNGGRASFDNQFNFNGSNGCLLVRDAGSCMTAVVFDVAGDANLIDLGPGGSMDLPNGVFIEGGYNTVMVHGVGAWMNTTDFVVQASATNGDGWNRIIVTDGARMDVTSFRVYSSNNVVSVTGTGTVAGRTTSTGVEWLGLLGSNNTAEVRDGATLLLAPYLGGENGRFDIAGYGTTVSGAETVALTGGDNFFGISNAATVISPGFEINGVSNRALVSGAGTLLTNYGYAGYAAVRYGTGNVFQIVDGAQAGGGVLYLSGQDDEILISGAGTRFVSGGVTSLISGTRGGLVVSDGAFLSSRRSRLGGTVTTLITGAGTEWRDRSLLLVEGPVSVLAGARLQTVEAWAGDNADLQIRGSGTVWTNSSGVEVGISGGGPAAVTFGEQSEVWTGPAVIGGDPESHSNVVQVADAGTTWHVAGGLTVGRAGGYNRLRVLDQAQVYAGTLTVGGTGNSGSNSEASISAGGLLSAASIEVGGASGDQNALRVLDGGTVTAALLEIRSGGELHLEGGTLGVSTLSKTSELAGGTFDFDAGTLNVASSEYASLTPFEVGDGTRTAVMNLTGGSSNQHHFSGGLIIEPNAKLTGQGTILDSVAIHGVLQPGHSAGTIAVEDAVTIEDDGEVQVEIFGDSEYDRVQADSITYGGTLSVAFVSFVPTNGARFQLFDVSSTHSGSFAATNVSGAAAVVDFDADSGDLIVTAVIPEAGSCVMFVIGFVFLRRYLPGRRRRR